MALAVCTGGQADAIRDHENAYFCIAMCLTRYTPYADKRMLPQ